MRKILYYENILEFKENTQSGLQLNEVKNWQLCRTCCVDSTTATATDPFIDFTRLCVMGMDGELLNVPDMLCEVTGLRMNQDRLPEQICKECLNKITTLYFFKLQAKRAEGVLKRLRCKLDETPAPATENQVEADCSSSDGLYADLLKKSIAEDADSGRTTSPTEEVENEEQEDELEFDQLDSKEEVVEIYEDVIEESHEEESAEHKFEYKEEQMDTSEQEYYVEDLHELVEDDEGSSTTGDTTNPDHNILQPTTIEVKDTSEDLGSTEEPKRKKRKSSKALLESLTCTLCHKSFKVQHQFRAHVQVHHPKSKAFKCRVCGTMFAHMQSLSRHMQTHRPMQNKNVCDHCGKAFLRSDDWKRHQRIHTGERPFACESCPKAFKQISELREHQHTHQRNRLFECNVCGHRLSSRNGLYVHKKSHDGVKKFACVSCDKRFLTNGELKSHMKVHSKEHSVEE